MKIGISMQNKSISDMFSQMQLEISEYHHTHMDEMAKLKRVKGDGLVMTKEAVIRLVDLESQHQKSKTS